MYVPGMDLGGRRADLGPIPLGQVDEAGVAWRLQELDGWDSAEVRAAVQQREADHGAWFTPGYLGERPITLTGKVEADDLTALDEAKERLLAAVSLSDTLLVVYESIPKQGVVRKSGKPLFRYLSDTVAEYSLLVTAADPRRYSTALRSEQTALPSVSGGLTFPVTFPITWSAVTVSGDIDAHNEGSFPTSPRLAISGPVQAPQILCQRQDGSVQILAYSQDLASGDQLVIDTAEHTVVINGNASRRRWLSAPNGWPQISAGENVSFQFRASAYDASALLTVQWRSAWT